MSGSNGGRSRWLGLPTGATSGTRSVQSPSGCSPGGPSCNVWSQNYFLGAEVWQSHSDWAQGTTSSTAVPACASTYAYDLGPYRTRRVGCPFGYQGATDHCWRDPSTGYSPGKSLGRCKDCDLMVGHPVNVATGNKYLEESDYKGSGPFPLEYTRRYNSLAWTSGTTSPTGPDSSTGWVKLR